MTGDNVFLMMCGDDANDGCKLQDSMMPLWLGECCSPSCEEGGDVGGNVGSAVGDDVGATNVSSLATSDCALGNPAIGVCYSMKRELCVTFHNNGCTHSNLIFTYSGGGVDTDFPSPDNTHEKVHVNALNGCNDQAANPNVCSISMERYLRWGLILWNSFLMRRQNPHMESSSFLSHLMKTSATCLE